MTTQDDSSNKEPFHGVTWSEIGKNMGDTIESFGRWLKKPGKRTCPQPKQPLLLGVYFVIILTSAAVAVLTKLIQRRLLHDRWDEREYYGAYPEPKVMVKLVLAGYSVTGVGLAVAVLGLITTFCRPKWLLAIGMVLCGFAIVLSLGMVGYGATAHIFENIAIERRMEHAYNYHTDGFLDNNYDYYDGQRYNTDPIYYKNREFLEHDYSEYVIIYYEQVVQDWKKITEVNDADGQYAPVKKEDSYYTASEQFYRQRYFPSSDEIQRNGSGADRLLPHLINLLDISRLLAGAHRSLIREDVALVSDILRNRSEVITQCYQKYRVSHQSMRTCLTNKDEMRREHMFDIYRSLIAMATLQAVLCLVVAIIFGKACCNGNKKVVVYLRYPLEGDSSLQEMISESTRGAAGVTIICERGKEKVDQDKVKLLDTDA